jgi:hypothetical protein
LLSVKRWLNLRTIFQSSNSPRCWSSAAAVSTTRRARFFVLHSLASVKN